MHDTRELLDCLTSDAQDEILLETFFFAVLLSFYGS
jgi:hypothetical protein